MASKILNTARTLYAENEAASLGQAVKQAVHAHASAAFHPTNLIGKTFGYGSFIHTMARRSKTFGEPTYEPGGIKNPFKSDLKGFPKGRKSRGTAGVAIEAEQAVKSGRTDVVMLKTLGKVEINTDRTVDFLQTIAEGNEKQLQQSIKDSALSEENAAEALNARQKAEAELAKITGGKLGADPNGAGLAGAANGIIPNLPGGGLMGALGMGGAMGVGSAMATAAAGLFMRFFPMTAIVGGIGNGILQGYNEWEKTGDGTKALSAALNGFTFGLAKWVSDGINFWTSDKGNSWFNGNIFGSFASDDDPARRYTANGGVNPAELKAYNNKQDLRGAVNGNITSRSVYGGGLSSYALSDQDKLQIKAGSKPLGASFADYKSGAANKKMMTVAPTKPKYTAGGLSGLNGVSSAVPPEGARLLDAIAGSESPGYNTINGGKKFTDMSDHPFASTNKATGSGLAAGRYQFMPATWNQYKAKLGLPDFSPASQDIAAWALAQDRYAANTRGRNLQADLNDPSKAMLIGQALHGTWSSLPGGAEPNSKTASFAARLAGGSGGGYSPTADYSTIVKSQAAMAALDVPSATAVAQGLSRQQSVVSNDTQFEMASAAAMAPEAGPANINVMGGSGGGDSYTAAAGMSNGSTEGIDDIISKVLVAMGAVVQT